MNLERYEAAAVAAAREAGQLIRERFGRIGSYETKSNANDLVTEVDRACEAAIARSLSAAFPGVPLLGEEGVADREAAESPEQLPEVWVVDPIDGTMNFVYGVPYSSVSIALAREGEPVVGVVYDPYRDELFTARKGGGAYLNGAAIQVRPAASLQEAVVATGYPTALAVRERNLRGATALAAVSRNLRAMGSAALHMAYVAAGRFTLFYELSLNPWDLAAGAVLVREAGGQVTDTWGQPYTLLTRHPVASCGGPVHAEALRVVQEAGGADPEGR